MDIEQKNILQKTSALTDYQINGASEDQQLFISTSTIETKSSSTIDLGLKKDFIESIFNKSTNFWSNVFCNQKESQLDSRKLSQEIQQEKLLESDDDFNLFKQNFSDCGYNSRELAFHTNNEVPPQIQMGEDSHPYYVKTFQTINNDATDTQAQDSMFYLDDDDDNDPYSIINQLQHQLTTQNSSESLCQDNIDNYQLQNMSDGKICIKRTNSQSWGVKKKPFSRKEDTTIMELLKKHGRDFRLIAQLLPGRTEQMIRNRYKSKIRNSLKSTYRVAQFQSKNLISQCPPQVSQQSIESTQFQLILNNQFINQSFCSKLSDLEKLKKIKKLRYDIEKIEDLLHTTKSEIIMEYLAILAHKNSDSLINNQKIERAVEQIPKFRRMS